LPLASLRISILHRIRKHRDSFLCEIKIIASRGKVVGIEISILRAAPAPVEMIIIAGLVTVAYECMTTCRLYACPTGIIQRLSFVQVGHQ
jgi:hypothetical protein